MKRVKKKPLRSAAYLKRMRDDGFFYISRMIHKDDLAKVDAIVQPRLARAAADRRLKRGCE